MKTSLLSRVFFLSGFVLLISSPALGATSLSNIVLSHSSPTAVANGEHVDITFDYSTDEVGGLRIQSIPFTEGAATPSYGVCGSPLYPSGNGSGSCYVTVSSGDVVVDQIQLRAYTADFNTVLAEVYIDVEYHFGNAIADIHFNPLSPNTLSTSENVTVFFDYANSSGGNTLIFARPLWRGGLASGYLAHSSNIYAPGSGSDSGYFTITIDGGLVDQVRVQMLNDAQTLVLAEEIIDVNFRFCDGPCRWYVDHDAPGSQNGSSWNNAFHHLQDALAIALAGDEIWVAEGTYSPDADFDNSSGANDRTASFALIDGVAIYGGFDGTEAGVNARDVAAHPTILSGEIGAAGIADNSYHVVLSSGNDGTATLDGFTVTDGNANGVNPNNLGGGMLLTSNSNATINNCSFENNKADGGAGLAAWLGGSSSILNCDFINNVATGSGGGIYLQAHNPTIRSTRFIGNTAQTGGGIFTLNNTASSEWLNCLFNCNASTVGSGTGGGGAIKSAGIGIAANPFPPKLINATLVNNTAVWTAGGISNVNGNDMALDSCILWGNSDVNGMVESSQYTASGTPSIQYSNIQGWTGALGGVGNIGADPLFVDADGIDDTACTLDDDFRLAEGSPSIDTGNPAAAFNDPDGSRNDMGAFGGPGAEEGGVGVFPGSGFIFTTVGVVPTSEITQSNADPDLIQGTANVSPAAAADLSIPAYENTAFGRSLWLHGLFGDLDTQVDFYQVQAGPWSGNTPPAEPDFVNLDDKLVKVLYSYNPIPGEWTSERITLGPQVIDSVPDLYQLTTTGFWSLIDLRLVWNTQNYANGKYTLRIKAYQESAGIITDVTGTLGAVADLIIYIDNSPVTATIHSVKYDPSNPGYDPNTDGDIPECGIISLLSDTENLRFTVTASHPNGFLRLWRLDALFGSNQNAGIIAGESYTPPPALWSGVTNQEYDSEDATALDPWEQCAYQFRLRSWARVTNGFNYIISNTFNEHLTIELGGAGCGRADIDNSGFVDLFDLRLLGFHWLETCEN